MRRCVARNSRERKCIGGEDAIAFHGGCARRCGLTLIELLTALVLFMILTGIALSYQASSRRRMRWIAARDMLTTIANAQKVYHGLNDEYVDVASPNLTVPMDKQWQKLWMDNPNDADANSVRYHVKVPPDCPDPFVAMAQDAEGGPWLTLNNEGEFYECVGLEGNWQEPAR